MGKLDLRKELKQYYTAKKKPEVIDVPPGKFLTIVGRGEPGGESPISTVGAYPGPRLPGSGDGGAGRL